MEEDCDDKDDSKRRTRNLSEKKRRDQFNLLVNELSAMITSNNRKMDKSTILKSTISFLKKHNELSVRSRVHDVQEDWKPSFLRNEEFMFLILEALESFVLVFSATGQIYYVSDSISSVLGYNPSEVITKSMFDLVADEDRMHLYDVLHNPAESSTSQRMDIPENEIEFQCHLKSGSLKSTREEMTHELIQFNGHFRTNVERLDQEDPSDYSQDNDRLLFMCTGRLCTPQLIRDVTLMDSTRNEFTSRHSLEWKFLFLDHRAPSIIGYLPFEVLGTSGYDYYHFDDLEKVISCHEALMQKGELTSCHYRFLTKGQQWIWLQTRFYITYHQWNSKPEFVMCTHRVVSYLDLTPPELKSEMASGSQMNEDTVPVSPVFVSEDADMYSNTYQSHSQSASVKSASLSGGSTTGKMSWGGPPARPRQESDTASLSLSDSSRCERPIRHRDVNNEDESPVPQHSIGAQYLKPPPYEGGGVGLGVVPLQSVIPIPLQPQPVVVAPNQAQMQRKHEQLQQMIVRQQEELRQVKEQLLLARLGILPPLVNVPAQYISPDVSAAIAPPHIVYENPPQGYPSQPQPYIHHAYPHQNEPNPHQNQMNEDNSWK